MPIRPIDVRRKEFGNSFRGYDANQVDEFLDAVADEFERAYTDNSRMREEISSLRERLQQFEELEGSIRAALIHAEQAADDLRRSAIQEAEDLRRSAGREADFTIREAKARSHQMLAESSARVERIQESYEALQEAKRNFTNDFHHVLKTYMDMMENMERNFANDFRHVLKTYMDMMENMEIASAREIEAYLRERLDTESIAVAREAATHESGAVEPTEPEVAEDTELEEQEGAGDAAATERMKPAETASEAPQTEPEVEEPIAVAREAATHESGAVEPTEPEVAEDTELEEQEGAGDAAATERMKPAETASEAPQTEPEVEEPRVEPFIGRQEPAPLEDSAAVEEPAEAADVEQEEPALVEDRSSQSFHGQEEGEASSEERREEGRIFRASRFLRRRE